jgi:hypothetical protein
MRIVGRGYKAGRFTYVGNPSGTGRMVQYPFGTTYRWEVLGTGRQVQGLGLGTGPINRPVKRQVNGIDRRIKARRTTHPCYASSRRFQRAVHWGSPLEDRSNLGPAQMGHSLVTVSYPFRGPCELTRPQLNAAI